MTRRKTDDGPRSASPLARAIEEYEWKQNWLRKELAQTRATLAALRAQHGEQARPPRPVRIAPVREVAPGEPRQ